VHGLALIGRSPFLRRAARGPRESYNDVVGGRVNRSMTKSAAIVNTAMTIAIKARS